MLGPIALGAVNRGYSLVVLHGLLIVVASFVVERRLSDMGASAVAAHGLSSWGA